MAGSYGTKGGPFAAKAAIEYDSGWIDITDKVGQYFNITHNLNSTDIIVDITGKTELDGGVHQRHLGGSDCNQGWSKTYGGSGFEGASKHGLVVSNDGGYAVAGWTASFGAGDHDFWLIKTDDFGNVQWNQTYGGAGAEELNQVIRTSDNGYAVAGWTGSFGAGSNDFWLVKIAPPAPEEVLCTVNVDPDTLNLKSNGQWITAYITLPEAYSVEDIVLETVCLDGTSAAWSEIQNGVYMVKFDRAEVQASLTNEQDYESAPKFYDLLLIITGKLVDETPFRGSDTISVIKK